MFLYFRAVYSAIYEFSHSENGLKTYSLDQGGNRKYEEFIDGISASLNSQWADKISPRRREITTTTSHQLINYSEEYNTVPVFYSTEENP